MAGLLDSPDPATVDDSNAPINLVGLDKKPTSLTPSDLATMSHADLFNLRDANSGDYKVQQALAPYEHQAFAREATAANPLMAVPIALATPIYSAAKMLGYGSSDRDTTAPTLSEIGKGLRGVGQGLLSSIRGS